VRDDGIYTIYDLLKHPKVAYQTRTFLDNRAPQALIGVWEVLDVRSLNGYTEPWNLKQQMSGEKHPLRSQRISLISEGVSLPLRATTTTTIAMTTTTQHIVDTYNLSRIRRRPSTYPLQVQ
jgi:hypothetical protein